MIDFYATIKDRIKGKAKPGQKRSSRWRKVRRAYLKQYPTCFVCDSKKKIEVHHLVPFHLAPDQELNPLNLVTLCENKKYGINCHLLIGHLGNYRRINMNCMIDAMVWHEKIRGHK